MTAVINAPFCWAADAKPKVAVFPLGGNADEKLRDRVAFSLRAKLDRDGTYEPIDGPRMQEILADIPGGVNLQTQAKVLADAAKNDSAVVLIWGEMSGKSLQVHLLDLRDPNPNATTISKSINAPTDVRFAVEEILQTLKGVKKFEHMTEESVTHDPASDALWKSNPNLVKNGTFDKSEGWEGIYLADRYVAPLSDQPPATDRVVIYREPGEKANRVLAMKLSEECASNNGMACLSASIPIEPKTRYRLSYRFKSDGPHLHVFVKGYTLYENIKGEKVEREIYRRQVPESGKTEGWVEVVDDLNPQHVSLPVTSLRIDLYAYLVPGTVMFDDVVLKAVGTQTRDAKDAAIKKPSTRPVGAK